MAREIKFRAWDKNKKRFLNKNEFIDTVTPLEGIILAHPPFIVLMQFTGLKDKNGKDIYEGDIIKNDNGELLIIEWQPNECAFAQVVKSKIGKVLSKLPMNFNSKQVIGNIYEPVA